MEPRGRNPRQSAANRRDPRTRKTTPNPLPPAATGCLRSSMVRRGSPVRVRKRASAANSLDIDPQCARQRIVVLCIWAPPGKCPRPIPRAPGHRLHTPESLQPATDRVDQYGRLLRYVVRASDGTTRTFALSPWARLRPTSTCTVEAVTPPGLSYSRESQCEETRALESLPAQPYNPYGASRHGARQGTASVRICSDGVQSAPPAAGGGVPTASAAVTAACASEPPSAHSGQRHEAVLAAEEPRFPPNPRPCFVIRRRVRVGGLPRTSPSRARGRCRPGGRRCIGWC